jgi:hypothetical protein
MRWNKYVKDISINSNKKMLCCRAFSLFLNVYYLVAPEKVLYENFEKNI